MSPEQLEGKEADARTDIFSLGCVLYEMATGQRAFTGTSKASLIAAVLGKEPPPISSVVPMAPPALDRLVKTCLAKDPEDRFHTAHDVRLQLQWIVEGGSQAGVPAPVAARRRSRERYWILSTAALALFSAALLLLALKSRPAAPRTITTSILPPEKTSFDSQGGPMALSPDGTKLAFVGARPDGRSELWVRSLSAISAQPLQGTERASFPFWSPDSRHIGFFSQGKLKRIDASGGPPETICDATSGRGATWGADGTIVFAPAPSGPLYRVAASGGTPSAVTKIEDTSKESSHRYPSFLPDGKHFLFLSRSTLALGGTASSGSAICVGALDGSAKVSLLEADTQGHYAEPGYLFYWRDGSLMARPFNARKLRLEGDAFPVAEGVLHLAAYGLAFESISENGILAYLGGAGTGQFQLAWYDRTGREIEKVGPVMDASRPRLSHDGARIAFDLRDPQSGNIDIWIDETVRKTLSRFTFDAAADQFAVWSPDDRWIVFSSNRKGAADIYRKATSGTGAEEVIYESKGNKLPWTWSPDGRTILLNVVDPMRPPPVVPAIASYSLDARRESPFIATTFRQGEAVFSPDGRFVAYTSAESGRFEIYAQEFPGPGGKWQISTEGGEDPVWSRDGKEIFYVAPGNRLMSVPVTTKSGLEAGTPAFLFEARFRPETGQQYDVSSDGKRFIIVTDIANSGAAPVTLVQNWLEGRRR
jgi:Tol biopolymer transport system component